MAKTKSPTKKKTTKKRNSLAGISKVKPATIRDLEKERERELKRVETGSLEQDYADFSALVTSRGWQKLLFVNAENAKLLEKQILDKKDLEGEELDEAACDLLRHQRDAILEVTNFPNTVIERYQEENVDVEEAGDDGDPYEHADDVKTPDRSFTDAEEDT